MTAARSSRSKWDSTRCFVTVFAILHPPTRQPRTHERRKRENVPLRVPALELTREEVAQPALEEGNDSTKEEEPDAPSGRPEPDSRSLADGSRVEARVDLRSRALISSPHKTDEFRTEKRENSRRA